MKMVKKEFALAASPLSFIFICFAFLVFAPGYPILLAAFFVSLGCFYSFQKMRENNDIGYSMLLPVSKADFVRAKFIFCMVIEGASFVIIAAITVLRMAVLSDAPEYTSNALMGANFVYLGFVLLIFGLFNLVFVGGFFRTAYRFARPLITYIILSSIVVALAETLVQIPGLEALGTLGFDHLGLQIGALCAGVVIYIIMTAVGICLAIKRFERIDL